jgi:pimeloyl-ACP methyl ester carboxylesterase
LCAVLFGVSACKKEIVSQEESLNGEVSADNLTANEVLETSPAIHTAKYISINSNTAGYWESLPARYSVTTKKYPLIVFIHGIGELGTTLSRINCCGLPKHLYNKTFPPKFYVNGAYHSFIVLSPQFKVRPSAAQVQSVIDYAKRKYRVDETRVYVTGLSMGGGSTWDYSAVYGQSSAAIVPICGGTKPTTTLASKVASKYLPVWTISSEADEWVPIQWAKDWIRWIDYYNPNIAPRTKLTVWKTESHNQTWYKAFNPLTKVDGYSIYEWMLLHRRTSATSTTTSTTNKLPVAKAGADQTVYGSSATLTGSASYDPDGWVKYYKWTKVSGPSSYWLYNSSAPKTSVNGLVAGTYVFRLKATDDKGGVDYDDVTIIVKSSITSSTGAPVARAGADQTIPKSWNYMPTLNGTASYDSDGYIKAFKWTKISGPSSYWFYPSSTSAKTKAEGLVAGTYVFRLTVTDNSGKTDTDDVTVTITNN